MMWMAKLGTGIVPNKDILNAAKRLRVTQDVEIELDRCVRRGGGGLQGCWLAGPLGWLGCGCGRGSCRQLLERAAQRAAPAAPRTRCHGNVVRAACCRFEGGRQVVRQKYEMVQLPVGPVEEQLALAVDTCGTLSLGLGVGEPVAAADVEDLAEVLAAVWPTATREQLLAAVAAREGRGSLYT
jgi:hypothetical protein